MRLLAVVEGDTDIPVVRALARLTGWVIDPVLDGWERSARCSPR